MRDGRVRGVISRARGLELRHEAHERALYACAVEAGRGTSARMFAVNASAAALGRAHTWCGAKSAMQQRGKAARICRCSADPRQAAHACGGGHPDGHGLASMPAARLRSLDKGPPTTCKQGVQATATKRHASREIIEKAAGYLRFYGIAMRMADGLRPRAAPVQIRSGPVRHRPHANSRRRVTRAYQGALHGTCAPRTHDQ